MCEKFSLCREIFYPCWGGQVNVRTAQVSDRLEKTDRASAETL